MSFSFLFQVQEELEYSWPFAPAETVVKDWGFCATGFGRKKEFAVEKSRFGVRLNSKKMGDGSAVSRSTRSQLQGRCVFLGKMKRRIGFGTIIAKTRGHVLSP